MICTNCKRRLRVEATSCICGWSVSGKQNVSYVDCGYGGCGASAVCRIWTATGWLNVCLSHYQTTEPAKRRSESPTVREIREAFEERRGEKEAVRFDLPTDELEQRLMDAAQI